MRQAVIDVATSQIGVKESPKGSNLTKYGEWFGLNGRPWCGMFVSWCFDSAGLNLGRIDYTKGFAGCRYATRNIKKWGRLVTQPQPGDVVFLDFDGNGVFDHTGIYVKDNKAGFFQCIEGNTGFGNDANGGEVMSRERRYRQAIFIRPRVLEQLQQAA